MGSLDLDEFGSSDDSSEEDVAMMEDLKIRSRMVVISLQVPSSVSVALRIPGTRKVHRRGRGGC